MNVYAYMVIIVLSILLISLLFLPIIINLQILKDDENDKIILDFKTLFGIVKHKIEIPFVELSMGNKGKPYFKTEVEESENNEIIKDKKSTITIEEMKKLHRKIQRFIDLYFDVIEYVCKKMKVTDLVWTTEFGESDAAVTGILTGIFWAIKGSFVSFINNKVKCNKVDLKITPEFNQQMFKTRFNCIISIKIGYIIIAKIKRRYIYLTKGGE